MKRARHLLETYPWPGNVRELENGSRASCRGGSEITARMLAAPARRRAAAARRDEQDPARRGRALRARYLGHALERNQNRRIVTARELEFTRECLYKLRRYGCSSQRRRKPSLVETDRALSGAT